MDLTATPRRRRLLFALLYLAEGAPIGFLWWALPTLLREAHHSLTRITTFTALIAVPWTFKFLGGPLIDVARGAGWSLSRMLIVAQLAMAATLFPLARSDAVQDIDLLMAWMVAHATFAALQDVIVDALCISVTPLEERGRVNGWMQAGMLLGRGAFGGGALLIAHRFETEAAPRALIAVVVGVLLVVVVGVPASAGAGRTERPFTELRQALASVVRLRDTWRAVAFALVAAAGFESAGAVAGAYFVDHGLTTNEIALQFELPKVIAMALGALLGGRLCDRWGAGGATYRFQLGFVCCLLVVAGIDFAGFGGSTTSVLAWVALYLAIGLFTAASYALLMDSTHPRLAATQFSAYMGATNACEAWSVLAVGRLQATLGYAGAFSTMALVSLAALKLVPRAPEPRPPSVP